MTGKDTTRAVLSTEAYVEGVRSGDRAILGRAITLIESRNREHRARKALERRRRLLRGRLG